MFRILFCVFLRSGFVCVFGIYMFLCFPGSRLLAFAFVLCSRLALAVHSGRGASSKTLHCFLHPTFAVRCFVFVLFLHPALALHLCFACLLASRKHKNNSSTKCKKLQCKKRKQQMK